ncbi:MAG: beta-barrel assembly-enhancing protease [Gammaproteobacteria bacterium]
MRVKDHEVIRAGVPACRLLTGLLAMLWTLTAVAGTDLPDMGDPSATAITPHQERELGQEFMRQARQQLPIMDDPLLNEYLNSLGARLVSNSDDAGQPFTFFLIDDPVINAFAVPGGFIGVDSGLLLTTQSESELASVLSHEIAHITQHHMARGLADARRLSIPTAAALLAAILLATQNPEMGTAAIAASQAGAIQHQINFTRADEEEADRIGIGILARSGFDPSAMGDFFRRLAQATRYQGPQLPPFLLDHPVTVDRIADARARAAQYPPHRYRNRLVYYLARARLEALVSQDPWETARRFRRRIAAGQYEMAEAAHYGHAIALQRAGHYDAAVRELDALLREDPDRVELLMAKGKTQLAGDHAQAALKTYAYAARLYPDYYPLTIEYGNALLQGGQARQARDLLLAYVRNGQPDPMLYSLLARAANQGGFISESHEFQAQFYYLNG